MFGGYPPTAIGYPPTAIGYTPTAIGYLPAAIVGRIGHSEFFIFIFIMATPAPSFALLELRLFPQPVLSPLGWGWGIIG